MHLYGTICIDMEKPLLVLFFFIVVLHSAINALDRQILHFSFGELAVVRFVPRDHLESIILGVQVLHLQLCFFFNFFHLLAFVW